MQEPSHCWVEARETRCLHELLSRPPVLQPAPSHWVSKEGAPKARLLGQRTPRPAQPSLPSTAKLAMLHGRACEGNIHRKQSSTVYEELEPR